MQIILNNNHINSHSFNTVLSFYEMSRFDKRKNYGSIIYKCLRRKEAKRTQEISCSIVINASIRVLFLWSKIEKGTVRRSTLRGREM